MRYTASEKQEIIHLVEQSSLSVRQTLKRLDISKSTYYNWLQRYAEGGLEALLDKRPKPAHAWNKLPVERLFSTRFNLHSTNLGEVQDARTWQARNLRCRD